MINYGSHEHVTSAIKRHPPGFPKSKTLDQPIRKDGKRASAYSSKLGKMITSITGGVSSRRPTTAEQTKVANGDEDEPADPVVEEETVLAAAPAPEEPKSAPTSISPHYSIAVIEDGRGGEGQDYMERLLSRQSLSLIVLEGLDVSLPMTKQAEQQAVPSENEKRAPLQSRNSFNDTESKGSGSTLSVSRSFTPSSVNSIRSHIEPPTPSKNNNIALASSTQAISSWDEKSRREVRFYQRLGSSPDVTLGQAVEEMAAKALIQDKEAKKGKEKEGAEMASLKIYRVAQYLHGHDRISILASVGSQSSTSVSEQADVQAVAKASQMGQDLVRSAVLLAEQVQPSLEKGEEESKSNQVRIMLWNANIKTGEESALTFMSEATYLSSFGAFLDAILSKPILAKEKYTIVRMFQVGDVQIKFQVQPIIVYELLVEGPVVMLGKGRTKEDELALEDKRILESTRLEIQDFYASVKRQISALEHIFVARELDDKGNTIKPSSAMLSNRPSLSSLQSDDDDDDSSTCSVGDASQIDSLANSLSSSGGPLSLLSKLKKSLRKAEFELYDAIKIIPGSSVNDVRRQFHDRAKSAKNRLSAWEKKHLKKEEILQLEEPKFHEPEYFDKCKHAFPGSRYLVREEEPLSIIAYTLSSKDFSEEMHKREQKLNEVLNWRTSVVAPSSNSQLSFSNTSTKSSSTNTTASTSAASSSTIQLDPDLDENFHTPEPLQVNMKRKKRVKDAGVLSLTLKRVSSNLSSSQAGTMEKEEEEGEEAAAGASAQQVGVGGGVGGGGEGSSSQVGSNSFNEDETTTPTASRIVSSKYDTVTSINEDFQARIAHVTPRGSLGSMFEGASTAPPTPSEERDEISLSNVSTEDEMALEENNGEINKTPKMTKSTFHQQQQRRVVSQPAESIHRGPKPPVSPHIKHSIVSGNTKISCISWFAEDFDKLRQRWNVDYDFIKSMSRCKSWNMMGGKSKSGFYLTLDGKWIAKQLLNVWSVDEKEAFLEFAPAYLRYMMNSAVNDCPTMLVKIAGVYTLKIKNVKTGETKLKMSVQVLENVFAGDDGESIRFDIKGIRDRRVPATAKKDQGNVVEEEERAPVWWDGEWLDSFQSRAYVPECDKMLFRRALANDLAFLTASNVMDYSLLIGAHEKPEEEDGDRKHKQPIFRVRIVDFLGAWTLVKQLESSSKKAIKSQAPTIIPPNDYALRFGQAVETYFIPCPGMVK